MKIQGQLDWMDYLEANLLHMRSGFIVRLIFYGWFLMTGCGFVFWVTWFVTGKQLPPSAGSSIAVNSFFALFILLYRYVLLPRRVRQIFNQQKTLHLPFTMTITEEGLATANELGHTLLPCQFGKNISGIFPALFTLAFSFLSVVGFLSVWGWPFDLASHFRPQYAVGLTISAVFSFLLKRYKLAAGAGLFFLLNLAVIIPLYVPGPVSAVSSPTYRAISLNIHHENQQYDQIMALIHVENPDFLILVDASDAQLAAMKPIEATYPYQHRAYFKGHESRIIYSKHPFLVTWQVVDVERPSPVVQLNLNGRILTLIAAHPDSPLRPENAPLHRQQLLNLTRFINRQETPVLLLGDLNTTPWSAVFQEFLRQSGLRNGRNGFGLQLTWPAPFPLIPIDHALASPEITIHHFQAGPSVGSDHYPLIVDFSIGEIGAD